MKNAVPDCKIPLLSFSDFDVLSMQIHLEKKELRIDLEGGVIGENSPQILGEGFISFKNWKKILIREFSSNTWADTQDTLKEICEFTCENNTCILKGFGKSRGQWIEFNITGATIEAEFENVTLPRKNGP